MKIFEDDNNVSKHKVKVDYEEKNLVSINNIVMRGN